MKTCEFTFLLAFKQSVGKKCQLPRYKSQTQNTSQRWIKLSIPLVWVTALGLFHILGLGIQNATMAELTDILRERSENDRAALYNVHESTYCHCVSKVQSVSLCSAKRRYSYTDTKLSTQHIIIRGHANKLEVPANYCPQTCHL